jgi:hypothetical protein
VSPERPSRYRFIPLATHLLPNPSPSPLSLLFCFHCLLVCVHVAYGFHSLGLCTRLALMHAPLIMYRMPHHAFPCHVCTIHLCMCSSMHHLFFYTPSGHACCMHTLHLLVCSTATAHAHTYSARNAMRMLCLYTVYMHAYYVYACV